MLAVPGLNPSGLNSEDRALTRGGDVKYAGALSLSSSHIGWKGKTRYIVREESREVVGPGVIVYLPCTWENRKFRLEIEIKWFSLFCLGSFRKYVCV